MEILGIDIGGSGIKGAIVNTETGELTASRIRIATPSPSKPANVADIVADIVDHFDWKGMVGCGLPAPIHRGVVLTAANIHSKWVGTNAEELFSERTGCQFSVINDADAAGLAEMKFGAGRDRSGVVLIITIGTGLGTSAFTDGLLLPNLELGHVEINGVDAESKASDAARKREKLSWKKWAARFNNYLNHVESLMYPDLVILGGGASKKADKFLPYIKIQAEIAIAQLLNDAGIVGAALAVR